MCDSPDLDGVQGVAGGPVHWHFTHDEHHDLRSLVVGQVSPEKAWRENTGDDESALEHKDLNGCRAVETRSLFSLSGFNLYYHKQSELAAST